MKTGTNVGLSQKQSSVKRTLGKQRIRVPCTEFRCGLSRHQHPGMTHQGEGATEDPNSRRRWVTNHSTIKCSEEEPAPTASDREILTPCTQAGFGERAWASGDGDRCKLGDCRTKTRGAEASRTRLLPPKGVWGTPCGWACEKKPETAAQRGWGPGTC